EWRDRSLRSHVSQHQRGPGILRHAGLAGVQPVAAKDEARYQAIRGLVADPGDTTAGNAAGGESCGRSWPQLLPGSEGAMSPPGGSSEHMARMRAAVKHHCGGRPRNPFYDALEKYCANRAGINLQFINPPAAARFANRLRISGRALQISVHGNTVKISKREGVVA